MNVAAIAALLALVGPETISLDEYRDRLAAIRSAVDGRDLEAARSRASELLSVRVRHGGGTFDPDPTVLRRVADAKDLPAAREAARAVSALHQALDAVVPGSPAPPDAARLERLRREEAERSLDPAGAVGGPELHAPPIPRSLRERILDLMRRISEVVGDWVQKLFKWLAQLLFGGAGLVGSAGGVSYLVLGLVLAVVGIVALVAFIGLRQRGGPAPVSSSAVPAASGKDEDPLSRTSSEWERFAAELMGSGRFREAVRAWYHAVLVTLFRSGLLHYRKDRTNWEYAYALGPELPWRPGFVEATRTFEQVWYGRREAPRETAEVYASDARDILEKLRAGRPA